MTDEALLKALDKPRKTYSVHMIVNPSSKDVEYTQTRLMELRDQGKVMFDINSGRWSKK